jgi:uncharacterized protein (TIGR00369 family)
MVMYATADQVSYFGLHIPYLEHLGVEPVECANDIAITRMPLGPHLLNSHSHAHGGALMSVLDFTLSAAARSHDLLSIGVATIDMSTSFLSPGLSDLTIKAVCIRRGSSICFCEGEIRDADGQLVAKAHASFKMIKTRS